MSRYVLPVRAYRDYSSVAQVRYTSSIKNLQVPFGFIAARDTRRRRHTYTPFTHRRMYAYMSSLYIPYVYISQFLSHWFKIFPRKRVIPSLSYVGNLCAQRGGGTRSSYLKKRSRIILYSQQNYDFRKRNPEVYISCRKVRAKFSTVSPTFRVLHLWLWTAGAQCKRV